MVVEKNEVQFTCTIKYQGFYRPTLNWSTKEGATIPDGDSVLTTMDKDNNTLIDDFPKDEVITVQSVLKRTLEIEDDESQYQCTVSFGEVPELGSYNFDTQKPVISGSSAQCNTNTIRVMCKYISILF